MDHFKEIYTNHASFYEKLISYEDIDNQLLTGIQQKLTFEGKKILDIGTGTGRIPRLVYDQVEAVIGLDLHFSMLKEHAKKIVCKSGQWVIAQGDLRELPFPHSCVDIVTAGWAIGHFQSWFPEDRNAQVDVAIQEMERVLKPGGSIIIIETLTTGSEIPAPPNEELASYYQRLEHKWGFTRNVIATDYHFPSLQEAIFLIGFFFGENLARKVKANNWVQVPEWTGIWCKVKKGF